jgi:hypothetical protein
MRRPQPRRLERYHASRVFGDQAAEERLGAGSARTSALKSAGFWVDELANGAARPMPGRGAGRSLPRQAFAPSFPAHRDNVQE